MNNELGLNRAIIILLALNAILGFIYTNLPNTYLEKSEAKELMFIIGLGAAAIAGLVWYYGRVHEKRARAKLHNSQDAALWESGLQWFLPIFFIIMSAVIGSRAVIIYLGCQAPPKTISAQITALPADKTWWRLKFGEPLYIETTLAAPPYLLQDFTAGQTVKLQYRETPYSYNFTSLNAYWDSPKPE